jgi:hypothetical protein
LNAGSITATNSNKTVTKSGALFRILDTASTPTIIDNGSTTVFGPTPVAAIISANPGLNSSTLELQGPGGTGRLILDIRDIAGNPLANIDDNGIFNANVKNFDIPHPTKEGYRLKHSTLEGPEVGVYVRGKVSGEGIIELPDYWAGLVHENSISVQLTPIGSPCVHYVVSQNISQVEVGCQCGEVNAYYTIFAERKDVNKLEVEYQLNN